MTRNFFDKKRICVICKKEIKEPFMFSTKWIWGKWKHVHLLTCYWTSKYNYCRKDRNMIKKLMRELNKCSGEKYSFSDTVKLLKERNVSFVQ